MIPRTHLTLTAGLRRVLAGIVVMLACVAMAPRAAAEVSVFAALNAERVSVGDSTTLSIVVDGASSASPPTAVSIDGCETQYLGGSNQSSQSISIINGVRREQKNERFVMQYRLTPLRAGAINIPALTVDVGGAKYDTAPLTLTATEPREDADFRLDLTLEKSDCYEGEPIRATLTWYLSSPDVRDFRVSGYDGGDDFDIAPAPGYEELARPSPDRANLPFLRGTISGRLSRQTIGAREFYVLTSELLITPKKSGALKVGPFRVSFGVRVGGRSSSFFDWPLDDAGNRERRVSTSQERELRVKPLPSEGRPADFSGLVGRFSLSASTDSRDANVGDPIALTLRIEGTPPLDRVEAPPISRDSAFTSRFRLDSEGWKQGAATGALRTFTTTLRPTSASVKEIPPMSLSFFDAKEGVYRTARSEAIPLVIRAAKELTAADAVRAPGAASASAPPVESRPLIAGSGGLKANYPLQSLTMGETAWIPSERTWMLVGALVLAPPALVAGIAMRRWRGGRATSIQARAHAAAAKARRRVRRASTPESLAEAIRAYIADVRQVPTHAMTSADAESLGEQGPELARVLDACERARFGDAAGALDELRARALGALARPALQPSQGEVA